MPDFNDTFRHGLKISDSVYDTNKETKSFDTPTEVHNVIIYFIFYCLSTYS